MTVIIPKKASKEQVKEALAALDKKKKSTSRKRGNAAKFFGINPDEVDGLAFQKKVRKEWR
jgi:hypothetical protein